MEGPFCCGEGAVDRGEGFPLRWSGEDVCVAGDLAGGTDAVPAEDAAV
mgnify:CR=1 FL=1